jgi:hypothetical protein
MFFSIYGEQLLSWNVVHKSFVYYFYFEGEQARAAGKPGLVNA